MSQLITKFTRFELRNPKENNKLSGTIEVAEVIKKKHLTFIDYLRCGVQISLSIAIDFTGSNGAYTSPSSLHFLNPMNPNQYEKAIWEVGGILEAYDSDKFFPVFGFGGIPAGKQTVDHCFPLNFDENNPYVYGVQGILDIYHQNLSNVTLSGPTFFHNLIDKTLSVVQNTSSTSVYYVLLILTDGAIMDMSETIHSIVKASSHPLSIIIIGVGNAEFDSMEALDSDKGLLVDSTGRKAARDIVQFVPFRNYAGNPVALAAEVLREVPNQLTDFMKLKEYFPTLPEEKPLSEFYPVEEAPSAPLENLIISSLEDSKTN